MWIIPTKPFACEEMVESADANKAEVRVELFAGHRIGELPGAQKKKSWYF